MGGCSTWLWIRVYDLRFRVWGFGLGFGGGGVGG